MVTMPGPSTSAVPKPRRAKAGKDGRQPQRRWIQLVDEWRSSSSNSTSGTLSRDELVEEISQHAQTLCRTIKDRPWLLDAFQMAINAVLLPETEALDDNEELSRVEQLGQQLLQLAIHSVGMSYLSSLKERNADASHVEIALDGWQQLSRRLSIYTRLRGLERMLTLPSLPLTLVLQEPTSTVLLGLASLPQGVDIVSPLLRSFSWVVEESASARLLILAQLLMTRDGGREEYASLAASGLLIVWKDGRESGIWSIAQSTQPMTFNDLFNFYDGIVSGLRKSGSEQQAEALIEVLVEEWQTEDVAQAITQLRYQALPSSTTPANVVQPTHRFDLASIQALAVQVSAAGQNGSARKQLAQQLLSTQDAAAAAQRVTQLVDTHDSLAVRRFALEAVSHAAVGGAPLLASVLYARPAVGGFRLDLGTPASLFELADAVVSQLPRGKQGEQRITRLGDALRTSLGLDQHSAVPACQLLVLLQSEGDTVLEGVRTHLGWLRAVAALVEGQSGKPDYDLCWLAAFGGDQSRAQQQQKDALEALLLSFDKLHPPPASVAGKTADRSDAAVLRFRAAWDTAFHRFIELTSPAGPFALLDQGVVTERLLSQILRTGDVELFGNLSSSTTLSASKLETLVLDVSTSFFDSAPIASTRTPEIRLSLDVLSALSTDGARVQRDFIEAACRLASFKIKSVAHPGQPMGPAEIRATPDKMHLVARLLATQGDAHRSPELVLDVANRLSGASAGNEKVLVEARTLAMLADSSTAAEEFELAASFCQRLVDRVGTVRNRTSASAAQITEIGWKTCFQLSKHPGWQDTPQRITMLAHAMTLAPPSQLNVMLRQWQVLDQQLVAEVEAGKVFDSTKKAVAGAGLGATVGELISAQTAASVGAGLVGTAANLLPLSFSPLSYFGASTSGTAASSSNTTAGKAAAAAGAEGVDARTAKLFDFDNVSGASSGGYVDPAERAVRAARAARDFLGWKSDQQQQDGNGGGDGARTTSGSGVGGFSFSRGVGWLIGDGKEGR